jgi:hypothetical protein
MNKGKKFYRMVIILLFLIIGNAFPAFVKSGLGISVSGIGRDVKSNAPISRVSI